MINEGNGFVKTDVNVAFFARLFSPTDQGCTSATGDHVVKLMSKSYTVILVLSACKNVLVLI